MFLGDRQSCQKMRPIWGWSSTVCIVLEFLPFWRFLSYSLIDLTTIVKFDLDLVKKHAGSILALTEFIFYMGKNRKKEINSLKIIHFILIFRPLLIVVLSNIAMYIYASVILKRITRRTASLRQSCKITKPHGSHEIEEDSDSNVKKQFSRALSTVTKSAKKTKDAAKIEK